MSLAYGIYESIEQSDRRAKDGHHWLYTGKCAVCGTIVYRKLYDFQHHNKRCDHKNGSHGIEDKRIANIFRCMKNRCYDKKCPDYSLYGGKGVTICAQWLEQPRCFEEWALSHGYDNHLTINRKDSQKDYDPDNCEWVTREYNGKYTEKATLLTVNGMTNTGRDWAKILGLSNPIINKYLRMYPQNIVEGFISHSLAFGLPKRTKGLSYIESYIRLQTKNIP